jgi:exodeoxyribonuclease V alpha subunit
MPNLDVSQQQAVDNISKLISKIYLLIGAGGSGKTFTIQHLLTQLWEDDSNYINPDTTFLAAPTGKAAKVINDAFARAGFGVENEAKTIHRLLDYNPVADPPWGYNSDEKLDASLVILDEASMVDSMLLFRVIDALPNDCVMILVGDDAQLPPVAPGQPFTDLIICGSQDIINRLTTNHRQSQGSLIADGCLKILSGNKMTFGRQGEHTLGGILKDDLFFLEIDEKEDIPQAVLSLVKLWNDNDEDYCILSPQHKGVVGVSEINSFLQRELNPSQPGVNEIKVGFLTLRVGDKVKNIKNNYELNVFNGYNGTITSIDMDNTIVVVNFSGEIVVYEKKEHIKQLALGYCSTIHSAQGSQYKKGVLLIHNSHWYSWNRSLLYTAISRFREELHVIGNNRTIKRAISNIVSGSRNTYLKLKLSGDVEL